MKVLWKTYNPGLNPGWQVDMIDKSTRVDKSKSFTVDMSTQDNKSTVKKNLLTLWPFNMSTPLSRSSSHNFSSSFSVWIAFLYTYIPYRYLVGRNIFLAKTRRVFFSSKTTILICFYYIFLNSIIDTITDIYTCLECLSMFLTCVWPMFYCIFFQARFYLTVYVFESIWKNRKTTY